MCLCFIAALQYHYETQVQLFQLNSLCSFVLFCDVTYSVSHNKCAAFSTMPLAFLKLFTTVVPVEMGINIL